MTGLSFIATKLVVHDVAVAERFYMELGFKLVSRNIGGEEEVRQEQSWLSETGDRTSHVLILSKFLEMPPPPGPVYPTEAWLAITVPDVDALLAAAEAAGGKTIRLGEDRPEHQVRAALTSDPDGHVIEVVGPMQAG